MRGWSLVGMIAIAAGCGTAPAKPPVTAAPKEKAPAVQSVAKESKPPVPPPAPVAADAFANPAAAVTALKQAVSENNSAEFAKAQSWLMMQKAAAIPALTELVRDEQANMVARTSACKFLAQLGPEAAPALLELAQAGTLRVRQAAILELGHIRPASQQVTGALIEMTQGAETEIRLSAITGLYDVEPPAKDAADAMLAILNSTSEPESLRNAAKRCLTKVNPRSTFND